MKRREGKGSGDQLKHDLVPVTINSPKTDIGNPNDGDDPSNNITITTDKSDYDVVLKSSAFVDKTLHLRSQWDGSGEMRALMIVAPFRCGKTTNMNMSVKFYEIDVDDNGQKISNVYKDDSGIWVEKPEEEQTPKFRIFKRLKVYKCYCRHKDPSNCQNYNRSCENDCRGCEKCPTNEHQQRDSDQPCERDCKGCDKCIYRCSCPPYTIHSEENCEQGKCPQRNFFYQHCGQHPVIFTNLKNVRASHDEDRIKVTLGSAVHDSFKRHKYLQRTGTRLSKKEKKMFAHYMDEEANLNELLVALKRLAEYLRKQFKEKVMVFVDEYDACCSILMDDERTTKAQLEEVTCTLGSMVGNVVKDNADVLGAVINVCLEMKGSTQYFNNVHSCPFLEDNTFADYCGFTHEEVQELLKKTGFQHFDPRSIQSSYDGYQALSGSKIYNTYSFLKFLEQWVEERKCRKARGQPTPEKKPKLLIDHWVDRGIPQMGEMLKYDNIRQKMIELQEKGSTTITNIEQKMTVGQLYRLKSLLCCSPGKEPSGEDVELFLFYMKNRGYLYAKEKNPNSLCLAIPNLEVQWLIVHHMYCADFYKTKFSVTPGGYVEALSNLNGNDHETFQTLANSIAGMFVGNKLPQNHDSIKGILYAYALTSLSQFKEVRCEPFPVPGRRFKLDLLIITREGFGIILEVASGEKNEEGALNQIFSQRYYEGFAEFTGIVQKIYLGMKYHYQNGNVDICGYTTAGDIVTKELESAKERLIRKSAVRSTGRGEQNENQPSSQEDKKLEASGETGRRKSLKRRNKSRFKRDQNQESKLRRRRSKCD